MNKNTKIFLIVLIVLVIVLLVFLWINGFEITRFLPRRGHA